VAGTATEQLYGMLEALYEPDMSPEQVFETMSQAFLNAVDRDAISGWGVVTYVVTKDKIVKRYLQGRMD
jgi:20S proteasome subunit beta 3